MSKWRRGRFWVASDERLHRADGWISGAFGVDRRAPGGYVVSHLNSGMGGGSYPTRVAAMKAADELERFFPAKWKYGGSRPSAETRKSCQEIVKRYEGDHPHPYGCPANMQPTRRLTKAQLRKGLTA